MTRTEELPTVKAIERVAYGCGAFASLGLTVAVFIGVIIVDESQSGPSGFGHSVAPMAFVLPLLSGVAGAGACLGMAITPSSVIRRRRRRGFVLAVTSCAMVPLLLVPSPMALFTWPLAVVFALVSGFLFRRAFADPAASP